MAPPPPPPGPPPPPSMPSFQPSANSGQERNMLLQSIRQGTKLKKTATRDRSAPALAGNIVGGEPTNSSPSNNSLNNQNNNTNMSSTLRANNGPPGLGGLFAGGMPKLKPTGLSIAAQRENGHLSPNHETKKNVNRGPPPQPPPASQKPSLTSATSAYHQDDSSSSPRSQLTNKPVVNHGKPNIAPRPPLQANVSSLHPAPQSETPNGNHKPSPPPKKIALNGNASANSGNRGINRTQSMLAPRSPPVAPPMGISSLVGSSERLNSGALMKGSAMTLGKHRGTPPTRAPNARPPPPPGPRSAPPTAAPPPPPPHHRTSPAPPPPPPPPPITRIMPAAPNAAPPAPPARNSSIRNGTNNFINELENRFIFHSPREFPRPDTFRNMPKVYSSRTLATGGKQQAPPPPTHLQLSNNKIWSNQASQC